MQICGFSNRESALVRVVHLVDCQLFIRKLSCAIVGCFMESNIIQTHESVSVAAHLLFVVYTVHVLFATVLVVLASGHLCISF